MYFDSHAHLDEACFAEDFEEILAHMAQNQVRGMMNIGCDLPVERTFHPAGGAVRLDLGRRGQPSGRRGSGGRGAYFDVSEARTAPAREGHCEIGLRYPL